jgi:hypothetical protein
MGQIHQKGSLSAKHEAKRGRGASPMATLPQRGPNVRETLANEIGLLVKRRALSPAEAARLAGETPQRISLLLSGKLYSFTTPQLTRIRGRLAA